MVCISLDMPRKTVRWNCIRLDQIERIKTQCHSGVGCAPCLINTISLYNLTKKHGFQAIFMVFRGNPQELSHPPGIRVCWRKVKCREPWHSTLKFWPKVSLKKSENSDFEHLGLRTVLYRVTYAKCDFDTYTEILSRGSKIDKLEVGPTGLICVRFFHVTKFWKYFSLEYFWSMLKTKRRAERDRTLKVSYGIFSAILSFWNYDVIMSFNYGKI